MSRVDEDSTPLLHDRTTHVCYNQHAPPSRKIVEPVFPKSALGTGMSAWRSDLVAGFTVAMVNVPLSIALGVASQVRPEKGILTAVWSGLLAALFGGSSFNIVGPTGALSGIISNYATSVGPEMLPVLSITSAIAVLIAYLLRWDRYAVYIPSSVMHGFTLGVAAIIAVGQFSALFGLSQMHAHPNALGSVLEVLQRYQEYNYVSMIIGVSSWLLLYNLVRYNSRVPWSIGIAAIGVMLGYVSTHEYVDLPLVTLQSKYGGLQPVIHTQSLNLPSQSQLPSLLVAAASVAFVSVLETLISGKIADEMTHTTMDQRQEVLGLAIANFGCGLAGGIPSTAALARTALNIRAGAQTRLSGILNAIFTALVAFLLMPLFSYIPVTIIASLLFQVSVGMIDFEHLLKCLRHERGELAMALLIAAVCCVLDPTSGIVLGAILALLRSADSMAVGFSEVQLTDDFHNFVNVRSEYIDQLVAKTSAPRPSLPQRIRNVFSRDTLTKPSAYQPSGEQWLAIIYRPVGSFTYLSAVAHSQRLRTLCPTKFVILSMRYMHEIDTDGAAALHQMVQELEARGLHVYMSTLAELVQPQLLGHKWYQQMCDQGKVFTQLDDALTTLRKQILA